MPFVRRLGGLRVAAFEFPTWTRDVLGHILVRCGRKPQKERYCLEAHVGSSQHLRAKNTLEITVREHGKVDVARALVPQGSKDPNDRALGPKYFNINGIWALDPYSSGPRKNLKVLLTPYPRPLRLKAPRLHCKT